MNPLGKNLSVQQTLLENKVQISDNIYEYYVILYNLDGNVTSFKFSGINELSITDDIKDFFTFGYMVYNNSHDALETITQAGGQQFKPYVYRGDGRDFLLISKSPTLLPEDNTILNAPSTAKKKYNLLYLFSIYDTEDLVTDDSDLKLKKLYFYDYSYQLLKEKNAYFTTVKNGESQMATGEAIKTLITNTLKEYNITPKFANDWSSGASKIFYSSPAKFKAIDDLHYLLDYHVSDSNDLNTPCILKKNKDEEWSLRPITSYFRQAYYKGNRKIGDIGGPLLTENFYIGKPDVSDKSSDLKIRVPSANINSDALIDYSVIESFQLSNMATADTQDTMVSIAVHNYDFNKKLFSIDYKENSIGKNSEVFSKAFAQNFKSTSKKSTQSNLVLNQTRKTNKNIANVFNPSTDSLQRLNSGRNKFLISGILLNTAISFKTRGSTARQAGTFFTVNRADNTADSLFDNKLLGIYFLARVEHYFINGMYFNNIIGVKTYNSETLNLTDAVI